MKKRIISLLDIKIKKIQIIILLLVLIATLDSGMTIISTSAGKEYIKDDFYQSVNYNPTNDLLSFTIPKAVPKGYRFFLHVSGRLYMGDKYNGMSFHAFDEESINYSWINGKTYTYSLNSQGLDFCLMEFGFIDKNRQGLLYEIYIYSDGTKSIERTD